MLNVFVTSFVLQDQPREKCRLTQSKSVQPCRKRKERLSLTHQIEGVKQHFPAMVAVATPVDEGVSLPENHCCA